LPGEIAPLRETPEGKHYASGDVARALLGKLPPIDGATRTVFARQLTLSELARLGGQTVAVNVLREAGTWLTSIAVARDAYAGLGRRYGTARLAYFAERVIALERQLVKEGVRDEAIAASRTDRAQAVAAARAERDHLAAALQPIVRGDPTSSGQLAGIQTGRHDDGLADALFKLASIANQWLERSKTDLSARVLVATFGLGGDDVEQAHAAREALIATAERAAISGARAGHDSPEVNVLEGIVLVEMRVALGIFKAAHARDARLPVLVPGPGTRHVLAGRPTGAAAKPKGASLRPKAPA
jgi:hypothetical protein